MGACSEDEEEDSNGRKRRTTNGENSIVLSATDFENLGDFKLCKVYDQQNRFYLQLIESPDFQMSLETFNAYHHEDKLYNHIGFDGQNFHPSTEGFKEPIADVKLEFKPHPCLI